jgi:hypothetical protein
LAPSTDAAKYAAESGILTRILMTPCPVCMAPAFPLDGACVFCHAPLSGDEADPLDLLDYLVEHIPSAHAKRGTLHRGALTEVSFVAGGKMFRARWKKDELDLEPPVSLTAWIDLLLTRLSDSAAHDATLRRSVLRAGWALR